MAAAAVITQFPSPGLSNNFHTSFGNLSEEYQHILTRLWSHGLNELNDIEEYHRPTPIQNEIITSGVQQWCNLHISLPSFNLKLIDKINYVWYKLSAHRKCNPSFDVRTNAVLEL